MNKRSVAARRSLRDWISWAENELAGSGVFFGHGTDNAIDEAAWLVGGALGLAPEQLNQRLNARAKRALTPQQQSKIRKLVARRIATRKPAAYLLREAWFAGLSFYVDERVIVPRSLTGEFIRERFDPWIKLKSARRILDLGTGSGCMAIACARAFPDARVDAADISPKALAVARINVKRHKLTRRVHLIRSDLFSAFAKERYDLIVTNPPYVGRSEMKRLPKEYRHEPALALASGPDGLDAITRILREAPAHLEPDGILVAEVGNSNAALQAKFPNIPFLWLTTETGDESVFLLTRSELVRYASAFK